MQVVVWWVVGLMALAVLPFAGLGSSGETPEELTQSEGEAIDLQSTVGTTTSHLVWSTTKGGDRVIRLTLEFDAFQLCGFRIVSGGWQADNSLYQFTSNERVEGGWTAVTDQQILHGHAANVALRFGGLPGNAWIAEAFHGMSASGTVTFVYAGFDLIPIDHELTDGKSIQFDLTCTGPFTITRIEGGDTVLGATPSFLTGGAGASVLSASLNAADSMNHVFSDPTVLFRMRTDSHFQTGLLQVSGPSGAGGTQVLFGDSDITHEGGSGLWSARFVRAANDATVSTAGTRAVALLAGLQDVQSLDEAADL